MIIDALRALADQVERLSLEEEAGSSTSTWSNVPSQGDEAAPTQGDETAPTQGDETAPSQGGETEQVFPEPPLRRFYAVYKAIPSRECFEGVHDSFNEYVRLVQDPRVPYRGAGITFAKGTGSKAHDTLAEAKAAFKQIKDREPRLWLTRPPSP
jgi:hypothetical protein